MLDSFACDVYRALRESDLCHLDLILTNAGDVLCKSLLLTVNCSRDSCVSSLSLADLSCTVFVKKVLSFEKINCSKYLRTFFRFARSAKSLNASLWWGCLLCIDVWWFVVVVFVFFTLEIRPTHLGKKAFHFVFICKKKIEQSPTNAMDAYYKKNGYAVI